MKNDLYDILEEYREAEIEVDDAINEILLLYKFSRFFNYNSFLLGMICGSILMLVLCLMGM